MTDAEIAYQIAEELISRAKASGAPVLSLSPRHDGDIFGGSDKRLTGLKTLPTTVTALTNLRTLYLDKTQVADLSPLSGLTSIRWLFLDNTQAADLSPLSGLARMERLTLSNTQVADLSKLSGLMRMQWLDLDNTQVADLSPLSGLSGLQRLWLDNTQADLGGLVRADAAWAVADLNLRELNFRDTPLTAEGEVLHGLYDEGLSDEERTAKALALLREARDRGVPPKELAPAPEPPFVFLSYSHEDSERVAALRRMLEEDGITIWQDVDRRPGGQFRPEIMEKLNASVAVLPMWSAAAVKSEFVSSEAERGRQQDKLVQARLDGSDLPLPFGERDWFNLSQMDKLENWKSLKNVRSMIAGDTTYPEYQKLLAALRDRLTADAPVGAFANAKERIAPQQRPIGVSPPETDEARRVRLIRAQSELTRLIIDELAHETNADARLARRLERYDAALIHDDPLWESIDNAYGAAAPLMKPDELDDGLIASATRWQAAHRELEPYINPEQPDDAPAFDPPDVDPDEGGAALAPLEEVAAMMERMPAEFAPEAPAFLRENRAQIAAAIDEGPDSSAGDALPRQRKWIGRSLYAATGFIGAVGSVATSLTWAATPQGQVFLAKLGEVWMQLMRLMY